MGRQKTKLQYVALLFRLWVDTLPSPLKLGASRLRCFRPRPDVCAKIFSHDYIARLKAGSEISVHKQLISQLSPAIESKSVFISERGLTSTQWTEYSEHTKRVQYSTVPTSTITAKAVTVDGSVLSQKDTAGVVPPSPAATTLRSGTSPGTPRSKSLPAHWRSGRTAPGIPTAGVSELWGGMVLLLTVCSLPGYART